MSGKESFPPAPKQDKAGSIAAFPRCPMPVDNKIYDSLPDPVILLDEKRHVVYANRAARDLLDCGAHGGDLAISVRHPAVLDAIDRLREGAGEFITEISFPVPVERTFELNAMRLTDEGLVALSDKPELQTVRDVLFFRDVTQAVRADQMRVDFVANASHELRSPLAALLGFIETLKGPAIDDLDARERFLNIMEREAHRMRRLIDDLLSLLRVEANEHVRPRGNIQIASCVRGALDVLKPRAVSEGMNVVTDIPAALPPVIGDSDQLTQVLHNLVENAIIHGRAGTDITVRAEPIERIPESGRPGVAVHITDQGQGIAKEMIPRLTERFFRVDPARSRSVPTSSTGLGLAIVKHIIARHRGRLTIDSKLGEGSTFSIYIPSE